MALFRGSVILLQFFFFFFLFKGKSFLSQWRLLLFYYLIHWHDSVIATVFRIPLLDKGIWCNSSFPAPLTKHVFPNPGVVSFSLVLIRLIVPSELKGGVKDCREFYCFQL